MRYTPAQKREALATLQAMNGDYQQASVETGIAKDTLRRWHTEHQENRAERLQAIITQLHEQLAEDALHLAQAIDGTIDGAPLNQLASALSAVVDRYIKLNELQTSESHEQVIRIEYKYPDGRISDAPPWADEHYREQGAVQGGRVWSPLRKDGSWQDSDRGERAEGENLLVARPDVSDGESGVAGFETRPARTGSD